VGRVSEALLLAFFEDLARAQDHAGESLLKLLRDPDLPIWVENVDAATVLRQSVEDAATREALVAVVQELVATAIHSILVSIDGGAASADVGLVSLVDAQTGRSLGEDLHSGFVGYLLDTGRIA
jgi:hypothetical protein